MKIEVCQGFYTRADAILSEDDKYEEQETYFAKRAFNSRRNSICKKMFHTT